MVRIVPRLSRLLRVSALTLLVAFLLALGMAAAEPGTITRVSVDSAGGEANGWSFDAALSADGRFVAFDSVASNLVPGDTNGHRDVFVHDRLTGATTRVSVDSSGGQGNGGSLTPALSADGRLVAFHSFASNLVPGDTNGHADVFVHDRETGATIRVSVDSTGGEAKCLSAAACGGSTTTVASDRPALSADGCFVAFRSGFANLVPADTNGHADIFVHDRQSSATTRVSVDSTGGEGISGSFTPALSADGRFVAFHSHAFNLVPGTTNSVGDIFVHDRLTGVTTRVSVDSAGGEANGVSHRPTLSADGRFVAFRSQASNLVPGDTNGHADVFVHDRQTGVTTRVSVDSTGGEANSGSWRVAVALSADGRFVAFHSHASNLVPGDTNSVGDIFVHDRQTRATTRVSVDSTGGEGNGLSDRPALSADGRFVAFRSQASNLVPGDTNGVGDIFVHDRLTGVATEYRHKSH